MARQFGRNQRERFAESTGFGERMNLRNQGGGVVI
jgi:hypothetical protein